ncbi:hypothetical protein PDESU_01778 [Pontiella desulfatans]|uniref:Tandem-95 repeat protein n=1 Tax=Pontiella desulfatans TaxID=2750659 RepID=A0A6C2U0H8_PONDE|nr:Ig-like domain-containing protein [Pontiella desulfatans]VGO13224.1 hypothetical protein PDESU_01778 [Pontiella desulfatans]
MEMKRIGSIVAIFALAAGSATAASVNVPLGNDPGEVGTQVGAGAYTTTKNGLDAEAGKQWGVANSTTVAGMLHVPYSTIAGTTLPPTIQAGTYTLSARIGNNGDNGGFAGLNDLSTGINTNRGCVAGFFTTLTGAGTGTGAVAQNAANDSKNNMYTEFNAVSGVTYTPPAEAEPATDAYTTWTFTWAVDEGSPVIGTDPYFGVYTKIGDTVIAGGNGFWDDSTLAYTPVAGVNVPPVAEGQDISIFPNTTTNITLVGADFEGSNLTYSVDSAGLVGALTGTAPNLTYTPANGYQGVDSFTFTVNDGELDSDPATVAITVTNQVPVASGEGYVMYANTNIAITLSAVDPDNGPSNLTYSVTAPANGTLSGTAPELTYTPTPGYTGADGFTFTVNDGFADSDPASISITVNEVTVSGTATISVNFHVGDDADMDEHQLTGAETAGLNSDTGWNNIDVGSGAAHNTAGVIFPSTELVDNNGTAGAATLAPSTNSSTWFVGYCANAASADEELNLPGTNHDDLFNSYLALNGPSGDGSPADAAALVVSGLGAAYTGNGYSVIVYSDSDKRPPSTVNRQSIFALSPEGVTNVFTKFTEDDFDPATPVTNTFSGTYIEADSSEDGTDYSNYVVFTNLTASGFTLELYADGAGGRGAINGFQIIANPAVVIENFGLEMVSGEVVLSWEGGGSFNVLTNEDLVYPNWGVMDSGTSPITITVGDESQLFYKLSE